MGRSAYERLRSSALVFLLRYTALRIGDVATLAKDRIRTGEIYLMTTKTGKVVKLTLVEELRFWNGAGVDRTVIRSAEKTLRAVFDRKKISLQNILNQSIRNICRIPKESKRP